MTFPFQAELHATAQAAETAHATGRLVEAMDAETYIEALLSDWLQEAKR